MELKADGIDQRTPLSKMAAATKRLTPNYVKMLHENKGFVGPWCSDGACAPVAADSIKMDMAKQEGNFIQPPCKSLVSVVSGGFADVEGTAFRRPGWPVRGDGGLEV